MLLMAVQQRDHLGEVGGLFPLARASLRGDPQSVKLPRST
jgi:hypothetical protein